MEVKYTHCAGLDVHKKTVVACRIIPQADGWRQEVATFGTMTHDLLALADWLRAAGVTHVAMESTGIYWRPIFNLLEAEFTVLLANAKHIKHVPGRKTDIKDAQWLAQLLQHGLLKPSFVPAAPQRALRELVRYRTKLIQDRTQEINRVQKVLEDANLKLTSVVSDVMGLSAREMLQGLMAGETNAQALAQHARGRMRSKLVALEQALTGQVTEHHRLLLCLHLAHIDSLDEMIEQLSQQIEPYLEAMTQSDEITRLDAIPGVGPQVAQTIIAELGTDMQRFPTAAHAVSWAGLAPGRNESAGRNSSAKTVKGNRHLKSQLVQAAHTVARSKDNYLGALFRRLAARRGKKRAAVAVARTILVIAYHMLRRGTEYIELGADYLDKLNQQQVERRLVKRLSQLGYEVILQPLPT
jgi:transposase